MLIRDNPVLTRELLVTLRSPRSFILQLLYVCALGMLVFFYWPPEAGQPGRIRSVRRWPAGSSTSSSSVNSSWCR